jgi:2-iminobutanoate/2-iminopropanoate deaminase
MTRDTVATTKAAQPRGPYAQAVRAGDLVFVAGQLPLDAAGALVGPGDITAQTRAALDNIAAILSAAGTSLEKVVKTTVFLTNLDDRAGMNDAYEAAFTAPYPARSTVEIGRLPEGMLVEIECVALA